MRQMRPLPQLSGLVLGMLMVVTGCLSGMRPVEVVSSSPVDNPDPGERERAATDTALPVSPLEPTVDNPDPGERAATALSVPAFPGAEGFGANSVGGRGGRVIEVTNLNDDGPGSLRAAVEAEGPRIVVFRTGGTIELQSGIDIDDPFITIAGQTAPGGGITLKNHPSNIETPLAIDTHDVIIRYIRSRPGASIQETCCLDGIEIRGPGAYNVIIDHCSVSWATDENMVAWYDPHDITIQWCIIAEGLDCSTHEKGCHSKGLLLGSDGSHSISVHHNLFAHNVERNPRIKPSGLIDVVNNVIYNSQGTTSVVSDEYDEYNEVPVNYTGNYFKRGVDSDPSKYFIGTEDQVGAGFEIFVHGNITPRRPSDEMDEQLVVEPDARQWLVSTRHDAPLVTTTSAFEAYDQVLANAGATIGLDSQGNSYWRQDTVDERIVNDVRNGTGNFIDDPSEVGGWPELAAGTAPADTDHDGMPDEWEYLYCFDLNDPSDGPGDADGDGYTNVEEYLNGTEPSSICTRLFLPLISKAVHFSGHVAPLAGVVQQLTFLVQNLITVWNGLTLVISTEP